MTKNIKMTEGLEKVYEAEPTDYFKAAKKKMATYRDYVCLVGVFRIVNIIQLEVFIAEINKFLPCKKKSEQYIFG